MIHQKVSIRPYSVAHVNMLRDAPTLSMETVREKEDAWEAGRFQMSLYTCRTRYGICWGVKGMNNKLPYLWPEGWKLVPTEPTEAMLRSAQEEWLRDTGMRRLYRAMIDAAPSRSEEK